MAPPHSKRFALKHVIRSPSCCVPRPCQGQDFGSLFKRIRHLIGSGGVRSCQRNQTDINPRSSKWQSGPREMTGVHWIMLLACTSGHELLNHHTRRSEGDPAARAALVAFYTATNGEGWANNSGWNSDTSYCARHGVSCSTYGHRCHQSGGISVAG